MKRTYKRTFAIIAVSVVFGIVVAVVKGSESGMRDSIGNMSAPWLLLPYMASTTIPGWKRGALMGLVTCLAALAGFYVAEAFVLDLGGHPLLTNLSLALGSGRFYFAAGALCGPVFGALGGLRTRLRPIITAAVVASVLVGEPLAVFAWLAYIGMSPADTGFVVQYPTLWVGEIAAGVILSAGIVVQRASRERIR